MRVSRTWWWVAGAAVAVAVVVRLSVSSPVVVEVTVIDRGAIRVTVDEPATTRVVRHEDVHAPVSGRFVPAALRVGDRIAARVLIGTLWPVPLDVPSQEQARQRVAALDAALRAATSRVADAERALNDAEVSLRRAQRLVEAGALPPRAVEEATLTRESAATALTSARELVRQAEHERASARAVVDAMAGGSRETIRVTAPVAGLVLRVHEEHERVLGAGTPLATIGDPREIDAVIPVLSGDATRIRPGAPVRFGVGTRGDSVVGTVRLVEPVAFTKLSALGVEEQRVNVVATVADATALLGDAFRLDARITVDEVPDAVRVPLSAIVQDGGTWFVFRVSARRAHAQTVQLGARSGEYAEVKSGLAVGDTVVRYPGSSVRDGARVSPAR